MLYLEVSCRAFRGTKTSDFCTTLMLFLEVLFPLRLRPRRQEAAVLWHQKKSIREHAGDTLLMSRYVCDRRPQGTGEAAPSLWLPQLPVGAQHARSERALKSYRKRAEQKDRNQSTFFKNFPLLQLKMFRRSY